MKKFTLLNFELGIPMGLMSRALESIDTSMYSFEAAVQCYHNFFTTGRYTSVPERELLPVVQSIVLNCPSENHPVFVKLREERKPYSRDVYQKRAA